MFVGVYLLTPASKPLNSPQDLESGFVDGAGGESDPIAPLVDLPHIPDLHRPTVDYSSRENHEVGLANLDALVKPEEEAKCISCASFKDCLSKTVLSLIFTIQVSTAARKDNIAKFLVMFFNPVVSRQPWSSSTAFDASCLAHTGNLASAWQFEQQRSEGSQHGTVHGEWQDPATPTRPRRGCCTV